LAWLRGDWRCRYGRGCSRLCRSRGRNGRMRRSSRRAGRMRRSSLRGHRCTRSTLLRDYDGKRLRGRGADGFLCLGPTRGLVRATQKQRWRSGSRQPEALGGGGMAVLGRPFRRTFGRLHSSRGIGRARHGRGRRPCWGSRWNCARIPLLETMPAIPAEDEPFVVLGATHTAAHGDRGPSQPCRVKHEMMLPAQCFQKGGGRRPDAGRLSAPVPSRAGPFCAAK